MRQQADVVETLTRAEAAMSKSRALRSQARRLVEASRALLRSREQKRRAR
ncbi:hypothetical protein OKJ48_00070 [Streptomyces kunmingensis]|uniref:Uncharacterized protein n=1 Tax=Streptomyces kunmingensis TaxID=68225 RepID=A0ABU6C2V7_9ACTN|nr:hypothetical protein [Streptomyces kunmingensis]MEB3958665.1 hypothetical protein [Streptomyces kunmingensis]